MEGATCGAGEELVALRKILAAVESQDGTKSQNLIDELSLV
jgi:zeta-carotene desaturase